MPGWRDAACDPEAVAMLAAGVRRHSRAEGPGKHSPGPTGRPGTLDTAPPTGRKRVVCSAGLRTPQTNVHGTASRSDGSRPRHRREGPVTKPQCGRDQSWR